jgi:sterol desaturase/sphingolipid hydroxylase (fatty acid hydroxylase superfamily)
VSTVDLIYLAAVPWFFGSIALEALIARRRDVKVYERKDTWANLAMGAGNRVLEAGWVLAEVAALTWLHDRALWDLGSGWATWVVAMVGVDLLYYWYHRSHHEVRLLWAVHVVHHSSRRYNLAVALRQPWLVVTFTPFLAPLALLGVPVEVIGVCFAVNLLYQFWIHTELIDRLPRWFEATCNTPSHHRVHHGKNPQYLDRNYAGILVVWDRLFGTFEPEREPVVFGLTKDITTYNPLRIATHELVAIGRAVKAAPDAATRVGHVLRGPGWAPPAVADAQLQGAPA